MRSANSPDDSSGDFKKICTACGDTKPAREFDRQGDCRDGLAPRCKPCRRAYNRESYERKKLGLGRRSLAEPVPAGHAWCASCMTVKELAEFGRNASSRTGRTTYCKPCHNAAGKASKERMGGSRSYHLKRRYGLTSADVDALVEAQGGRCALCDERDPQHVDHDHVTGEVRGVLCSCCNQGLGNFRDRPDLLEAAAAYLHRTRPQVVRLERGVYAVTAR